MQEAHGVNDAQGADRPEKPPEARGVMLSGRIESKLGLEPSEHRSSKPRGDQDATPAKRARLRRYTPRVNP
jgi:hypothetical protein